MSVIGGALVAGFGALLLLAGTRQLVTALSLYRGETAPLRDVATGEGTVEFEGQVQPPADEGSFAAPFSGTDALCCQVWMETEQRVNEMDEVEFGDARNPEDDDHVDASWQLAETADLRQSFVVTDGGTRVAVDPAGADLDITGHMGETVLTTDAGEPLPDDVRDRVAAFDQSESGLDGGVETWTDDDRRVKYREARLEPGDTVHVTGGVADGGPDGWGSGVAATVAAPAGGGDFLISEGTKSEAVRKHVVQFVTGAAVGLVLLAVGLQVAGVLTVL